MNTERVAFATLFYFSLFHQIIIYLTTLKTSLFPIFAG